MSALFSYARVSGCIFGIFTICAIYWDRSNSFFICFPKAPIFLPLLTSAESSSLMFIKHHIIVRYRIQMQALQVLTDRSLMESVFRLLLSRLLKRRFCKSQWHESMKGKKDRCVCVVHVYRHRYVHGREKQMDTNGQRGKEREIPALKNTLKLGYKNMATSSVSQWVLTHCKSNIRGIRIFIKKQVKFLIWTSEICTSHLSPKFSVFTKNTTCDRKRCDRKINYQKKVLNSVAPN